MLTLVFELECPFQYDTWRQMWTDFAYKRNAKNTTSICNSLNGKGMLPHKSVTYFLDAFFLNTRLAFCLHFYSCKFYVENYHDVFKNDSSVTAQIPRRSPSLINITYAKINWQRKQKDALSLWRGHPAIYSGKTLFWDTFQIAMNDSPNRVYIIIFAGKWTLIFN